MGEEQEAVQFVLALGQKILPRAESVLRFAVRAARRGALDSAKLGARVTGTATRALWNRAMAGVDGFGRYGIVSLASLERTQGTLSYEPLPESLSTDEVRDLGRFCAKHNVAVSVFRTDTDEKVVAFRVADASLVKLGVSQFVALSEGIESAAHDAGVDLAEAASDIPAVTASTAEGITRDGFTWTPDAAHPGTYSIHTSDDAGNSLVAMAKTDGSFKVARVDKDTSAVSILSEGISSDAIGADLTGAMESATACMGANASFRALRVEKATNQIPSTKATINTLLDADKAQQKGGAKLRPRNLAQAPKQVRR